MNSAQSDQSIPAIYGTNIASAMATLNQEGFYRIEVIKVSDSSAEDDSVVRSYPQQGSVVSLNETIYLYVAAGEADSRKVSVPNTIGYTKADAITKIESLGFECIVEPIESTKAKDTVVTQSPLGGELKSGSAVTIYVSALSPENSVTISVDLPQNITHSMQFTVAVEGVSPQTVTVYPGVATHNFSVTGRDYTTVRVLLDDQLYREYRVNFTEKTYEVVAQNEYVDTGLEQVEPTMTPGEAQ